MRLLLVASLSASAKVMCAFEQSDGTPMVEKITASLRQSATEFKNGKEGRQLIGKLNSGWRNKNGPATDFKRQTSRAGTLIANEPKRRKETDTSRGPINETSPYDRKKESAGPHEEGVYTYKMDGITYTVEDLSNDTNVAEDTVAGEQDNSHKESEILGAVSQLPFEGKQANIPIGFPKKFGSSSGIGRAVSKNSRAASRSSHTARGDSRSTRREDAEEFGRFLETDLAIPGLEHCASDSDDYKVVFHAFSNGSLESFSTSTATDTQSTTSIGAVTDDVEETLRKLKSKSDASMRSRSSNSSRAGIPFVKVFANGTAKMLADGGRVSITVDIDESTESFQRWLKRQDDMVSVAQRLANDDAETSSPDTLQLYSIHAYTTKRYSKERVCCVNMNPLGEGSIQNSQGHLKLICYKDGSIRHFDQDGNVSREWSTSETCNSEEVLVFQLSSDLACSFTLPSRGLQVWGKQFGYYFKLRQGSNVNAAPISEDDLPVELKDWIGKAVPLDGQQQNSRTRTAPTRGRRSPQTNSRVDTASTSSAITPKTKSSPAIKEDNDSEERSSNIEEHMESLADIRKAVQSILHNMST
eukprot:gb/GECG01009347.1/.p1 GENE.gb/GECG01009347.1/~~gb/GECG01009347.1/.p1  ORF type:complete len:585 (+),score=85.71 gb/GECG01009347.1/:1-1755(+)